MWETNINEIPSHISQASFGILQDEIHSSLFNRAVNIKEDVLMVCNKIFPVSQKQHKGNGLPELFDIACCFGRVTKYSITVD